MRAYVVHTTECFGYDDYGSKVLGVYSSAEAARKKQGEAEEYRPLIENHVRLCVETGQILGGWVSQLTQDARRLKGMSWTKRFKASQDGCNLFSDDFVRVRFLKKLAKTVAESDGALPPLPEFPPEFPSRAGLPLGSVVIDAFEVEQ